MAKPDVHKETELIDLLNQILCLEYSIIVHFPSISGAFPDREMSDKMLFLSTASIKHANGVAEAIEKLGGKPEWSFEPFPDGDLVKVFEFQVEKERQAHDMHMKCAAMAEESYLRKQFATFAKDEEYHEKVAQEVLDYLRARPKAVPR